MSEVDRGDSGSSRATGYSGRGLLASGRNGATESSSFSHGRCSSGKSAAFAITGAVRARAGLGDQPSTRRFELWSARSRQRGSRRAVGNRRISITMHAPDAPRFVQLSLMTTVRPSCVSFSGPPGARTTAITRGSVITARMRNAAPQCEHRLTSMSNTRRRRCAHVIWARVGGAPGSTPSPTGPLGAGTTWRRWRAFDANRQSKRMR